jgi:hypothetical protein
MTGVNFTARPQKSIVTALLLTFFFGPFGLFYVSAFAALMMLIVIPGILMAVILTGVGAGFAFIAAITGLGFVGFVIFYFPICMIWASIAVNKYNRKIQEEDYWAYQQSMQSQMSMPQSFTDATANQQQNIDLSDKKRKLVEELEISKQAFEKGDISEMEYLLRKEKLTKQIDVLTHNQSFIMSPPSAYETSANEGSEKKDYSYLIILLLAALIPLSLIGYQKGWFFDMHGKDKTLIKEQIEKTYFGIANGAYTSATIQGIGADGMPFYNLNLANVTLMGLTPLANIFGYKIQMEPQNIDVYNFIDDNTAQVRYDLQVITGDDSRSAKINMTVKKIGGIWKLDGEKFIGDQNKQLPKEAKKYETSNPKTEMEDDFKNDKTVFLKVKGENITENDSIQLVPYNQGKMYAISPQMVYEIEDGYITNKWRLLSKTDDVEGIIYKLDNGYKIFVSGFFVLSKDGELEHSYEVEQVNKSNIDFSKILNR